MKITAPEMTEERKEFIDGVLTVSLQNVMQEMEGRMSAAESVCYAAKMLISSKDEMRGAIAKTLIGCLDKWSKYTQKRHSKGIDADGMEGLFTAVVMRAIKDWRIAKKRLVKNPEDINAKTRLEEVEQFIKGPNLGIFTTLEPDVILRHLKSVGKKIEEGETITDENEEDE